MRWATIGHPAEGLRCETSTASALACRGCQQAVAARPSAESIRANGTSGPVSRSFAYPRMPGEPNIPSHQPLIANVDLVAVIDLDLVPRFHRHFPGEH